MGKNILIIIAAIVAASIAAYGQPEAYIILKDPHGITTPKHHGIALQTFASDGKERFKWFHFEKGSSKVYFTALDTVFDKQEIAQKWFLSDTMVNDGDIFQIEVFRCKDMARNLPEPVSGDKITELPPFLLRDGDSVTITILKVDNTSSSR